MSQLSYLFIYLLTTSLIGCQPPDTCYYDVSEKSLLERPGSWFRMVRTAILELLLESKQ